MATPFYTTQTARGNDQFLANAAAADRQRAGLVAQAGQQQAQAVNKVGDIFAQNQKNRAIQAQRDIENQRANERLVLAQNVDQRAVDKIKQDEDRRVATSAAFAGIPVEGPLRQGETNIFDPNVDRAKLQQLESGKIVNTLNQQKVELNDLALQQATPGTKEYQALVKAQEAALQAKNDNAFNASMRLFNAKKTPTDTTEMFVDWKGNALGRFEPGNQPEGSLTESIWKSKQTTGNRGSSSKKGGSANATGYTKLADNIIEDSLDSSVFGIPFLGSNDTKVGLDTLTSLQALGIDHKVTEDAYRKMKVDKVDWSFNLEDIGEYFPPIEGADGNKLSLGEAIAIAKKDGRHVVLDNGKYKFSTTSKPVTTIPTLAPSPNSNNQELQESKGYIPTGVDTSKILPIINDPDATSRFLNEVKLSQGDAPIQDVSFDLMPLGGIAKAGYINTDKALTTLASKAKLSKEMLDRIRNNMLLEWKRNPKASPESIFNKSINTELPKKQVDDLMIEFKNLNRRFF